MAVDLRCPHCEDNLGKDVENPGFAFCGTCGEDNIFNERGYTDEMGEEELARFKKLKRKQTQHNRSSMGRLRARW